MKKLILFILLLIWIYFINSIYSIWNTQILPWKYTIEKWDITSSIPKRFNLDINLTYYKIWLKISWYNINLLAWTYKVDNNISLSELVLKKLKKPDFEDREITILPWWNIFDIDLYLSNLWLIESWELSDFDQSQIENLSDKYTFLKWKKTLEWFLFPDTYRISIESDFNSVLDVLLDTFKTRVFDKYWSKSDFYNKLILASIVEREEKISENKPIVAWILQKRLNEWIAIWADATVCYSYKLTQEECTPSFINEHIYIKSSYNTRSQLWLPPSPISSVSQDTIDSTFNMQDSPYYYYLHDNSWEIHYWKNLQEHIKNKNLYLK